MKRNIASAVVMLVVAMTVVGCGQLPTREWITLIDGNAGMENWDRSGASANWRAEDGAIQADKLTGGKGAGILVSKRTFRNIEIYVEFWASDDTNSGIYLRAPDPKNVNTASGAYEVQIWDKNPNAAYGTGSLVNVAAVAPIYKAGGRWNTFEIYAKGTEITVRMNGTVTVSTSQAKTHEGRVAIQFNGGPIKVRKLLVREL